MVVKDVEPPIVKEKRSLYRASSMDRIASALFDLLIIIVPVVSLLISPIKQKMKISSLVNDFSSMGLYLALSAIVILLTVFLYAFISQYFFQKSIGQFLFGLSVKEKSKENVSASAAALRSLVWALELIFFGLPMLPVLFLESWALPHDRLSLIHI